MIRARASLVGPALLGVALVSILASTVARGDVVVRNPYTAHDLWASGRMRMSGAGVLDTVWIGHVNTNTGLPGTPGGYGPYHVGRGPHRLSGDWNGTWDFDHFQAGESDSLQGWWPVQAPYASVGGVDVDDALRPWFALDYGNQGNYSIPQGAPKRTFGVLGYWHRDPGSGSAPLTDPDAVPGPNPEWTPISGVASAWCGLRCEGDNSVVDPVTGNPFNSGVLSYLGNNSGAEFGSTRIQGTDHNFPGYGSQWDQMLYRDVAFPANASGNVTISFKYTTNMSLGLNGLHASQTGWFDKDPLKTPTGSDNNYISVSFVADVVDSFMVYVGAPVQENNCTFSDGSIGFVYDLQRRWFSEVVKINTPGSTYRELLSVAGSKGTPAAPITGSVTLSAAQINAILDADGGAGNGGRLRLVFRVKTNRGFDDENQGNAPAEGANAADGGFSSLTRGAAIIDDVSVSGGGATALTSGFESPSDIDNSTGVSATAAWKSTGKPPAAWFHVHRIDEPGSPLPYDDPAGAIGSPDRLCNMVGNVLVPGWHDVTDKPGGFYGSTFQDQQKMVVSPTINLMSSGSGDYNGMGIDADIAQRVPILVGDQYSNLYDYDLTGNGYRFGWQAYPATQANGAKVWGEMRKSAFVSSFTARGCLESLLLNPLDEQLVVTTNASGVPDSFRVYIESIARCFAKVNSISAIGCSPSAGASAGGYFDDLSIGLAGPPAALLTSAASGAGRVTTVFTDQFQDCFPVNGQLKNVTVFGLAYDTLAVRVQTGHNIVPRTNNVATTGTTAREDVAGDSALATGRGPNVRVDLVFRILPGPGNYVTIGNRASGVARRPDQVPRVPAQTSDGGAAIPVASKFWGAYMGDNGAFGTLGNGTTGPGHPSGWDPNRWNSARMDTAEINLFPIQGVFANEVASRLSPGTWMTCYHEADPKFGVLGIDKNRCFFQSAAKPARLVASKINCGNLSGQPTYPPSPLFQAGGVPVPGTGLAPSENGLALGHTYEYTKILPDGQLTPGSEVQYFYRRSTIGDPVSSFAMSPDTNYIFPQNEQYGYFDFHRWRELRVLPDRWKDPAFGLGGVGMACMLVVDVGERRGDLGIWTAVADSTDQLTAVAKRGAHNGWRARPDQDFRGVNVGNDDSICRRDNGGQPGSLWDAYSVIGGESQNPAGRLGSRGANHSGAGGSLTIGKWSTHGPSEDMLRNYRTVIVLADDIGMEALGPIPDATDPDVGLLSAFMTIPGGSAQPRGVILQGQRLGELLSANHNSFMSTFLRASLRSGSYRAFAGNNNPTADLIVQPPVAPVSPYTYGVTNTAGLNNDVYTLNVAAPPGQVGAYYQNVGGLGPYVASVYAPNSGGARPFKTLLNGWTLGLFGGFGAYPAFKSDAGGPASNLLSVGRRKYAYDLFFSAFGDIFCGPIVEAIGVGDGIQTATAFVNFMGLGSSNPARAGQARIVFSLAKTERARIDVLDVGGRLVRTVADRSFAAGQQHAVIWDGANDTGQRVRSGVYFYQIHTPTWTSQRKLTVLSN